MSNKAAESYEFLADQTSPNVSLAENMDTSKKFGVEKCRRNLHRHCLSKISISQSIKYSALQERSSCTRTCLKGHCQFFQEFEKHSYRTFFLETLPQGPLIYLSHSDVYIQPWPMSRSPYSIGKKIFISK